MNLPNSANSMYNIVKWYFDHFIPPYGTVNTRRSKRLCGLETCSDWGFFATPCHTLRLLLWNLLGIEAIE